jgi:DNA-binding transcriptional MerR regulator
MLTIGKAARRVGVRPSAIRYYETRGILRPAARGSNGYRIYDRDAVKMLLFVRRAQSLGITLKEIMPLLDLASQGLRPCAHVKHLTRNRLQQIDRQIRELQSLRKELRALLRRRVGRPQANEVCPIIQRGVENVN